MSFWGWFVTVLTVLNILGCFWLIYWTTKKRKGEAPSDNTTGHVWDENLQEFNNPLPRWWLGLFYLTIVFAFVYLYFYPGLLSYEGSLGWSSAKQYDKEVAAANEKYGKVFKAYAQKDLTTLINDKEAMETGRRLFLQHCSTCHGSTAEGAVGYPNLTDNDWIFGGTPDAIETTILKGRPYSNEKDINNIMGMPGGMIGTDEATAENVANYVLSLSGAEHDANKAQQGKAMFAVCESCHGPGGKGDQANGAPNLTDNIWLYGGDVQSIKETILKGRKGNMPAHEQKLGPDKVHLLAAYVYSLSKK
jgi:cytochrome c oxidase cbb3-type subunit 3